MTAVTTPIAGLLLALVGVRLLLHVRGQRSLPEVMLGIWLLTCGVGVVPLQSASLPGEMDPARAHYWLIVAHLLVTTGFSALAIFVWRTFGPAGGWRRGFALGLVAAQWLSLAALAALDGFRPTPPAFVLVVALLRAAVMAWAFAETLRYGGMMRRRVRIGLADPVVANRFTLWSVWTGTMCGVVLSIIAVRVIQQRFQAGAIDVDPHAVGDVLFPILAAGGVVAAICMALSFFPPEAYRRWLVRRAQVTLAGSGTAAV